MPIGAQINGRLYAIDSDHLNTPRRLTNTQGQVVWQWLITGYGEVAPTTGATGYAFEAPQLGGSSNTSGNVYSEEVNFKLRYPGQVWDEETGLSYNLNRYYDAQAGRYIQSDPIGLDGGWNRYSYVSGNPLVKYDLNGLTESDVRFIFNDVMNSFSDLKPTTTGIYFKEMPLSEGGETKYNGDITIASRFAKVKCFSFDEYSEVFGVLFHEMMHSTDVWMTILHDGFGDGLTANHAKIIERGSYEKIRSFMKRNDIPRGNLWGKPGNKPVDMQGLYKRYRERVEACKC